MKKDDLTLGISIIILGIFAFIKGATFPGQASSFPKLMSVILIIFGLLLLIRTFRNKEENDQEKKVELKNKSILKAALIASLFIIYFFTIEILGYIIPTFSITFLTIYILKYENLKVNLILSTLLSITLYVIFTYLFQVKLPKGIFF